MKAIFPSAEWLQALHKKLNADEKYARIARNWEGDLCFVIESDETLKETNVFYLDLWHGKCRDAYVMSEGSECKAAFILNAPYTSWVRILKGKLHPLQALATQRLKVRGNYAYLMRQVPTVLDFTRCAQEVTRKMGRVE
ncbi:MAG: SCP2 sterol-binding domain-containing protein [Anaerolineales bacterium]